ncbi:MAG: VOC family protein [Chitinophagales bacterium]
MLRITTVIMYLSLVISCDSETNKTSTMEETRPINENSNANEDNTPKVTGIGGIFFFSDNPETTRTWYANNLGLEVNAWGSSFESRDLNNPEQVNTLQWTPFKTGDAYFEPSKKEFMINYQVQNIEALIKQLEENGVTILDSLTSYDYGKFIHIMDADGNKIELWEPTKE